MEISGSHSPALPLHTSRSIGFSVECREIVLHSLGQGIGGTLLIGGMHGDERATVLALESFLEALLANPRESRVAAATADKPVHILPLANPDAWHHNTRYNARRVDINRNFHTNWSANSEEPSGPEPYSEPETRILRDLIVEIQPRCIVSIHWALAEIDADGAQSSRYASAMWNVLTTEEQLPYRLRFSETPPTSEAAQVACPGSLGQWAGYELRYEDGTAPAMITLELPYDATLARPDPLPDDHLETLRAAWNLDSAPYMTALTPSVHKMLTAACLEP